MTEINVLDVTQIVPRLRHSKIFATFDALGPGESFVLFNDHDPVPLRHQFNMLRPALFQWEYLEQGPESWRVRLTRV